MRTVVLMPPVVQLRRIELPRMTADDARRAIARNAARYFPDAREPLTVAVRPVPGSRSAWMVAAAPSAAVVEAYAQSIDGAVAVIPAHAAWAASARDGRAVLYGSRETTILQVQSGEIVSIRRLPAGAELPPELATARVIGRTDQEAERLAQSNAHRALAFELLPDAIRARRSATARRVSWRLAIAAAAMLLLSAGVNLWGERRELAAVRERRAVLREQVRDALLLRDTLTSAADQINAVAALDASGERWSAVIARVAASLPQDAHLTAFRAEADSVSLEGQASNAAGVFAAMRGTPGMVAVWATAPIRQEGSGGAGQPVIERFLLGARVNARSALGETP